MKRALNMLAEILALPYSAAFMQYDPLLSCAKDIKLCDASRMQSDRVYDLQKKIAQASLDTINELNQHTEIANLTEMQSLFCHVFSSRDIIACANRWSDLPDENAILHQYYFELLEKAARLLLTTRDGVAMLRPWDTLPHSLFHVHNGVKRAGTVEDTAFVPLRIELWNSLLRCLPEDLFICCYAAIQTDATAPLARQYDISFRILQSFGETIHIADALLDKVLNQGMAETHMHANASRSFGLIWEDMLELSLRNTSVLKKKAYKLPFKALMSREQLQFIALESAVIRLLLGAYMRSGLDHLLDFIHPDNISTSCSACFRQGVLEIYQSGQPKSMLSVALKPGAAFLESWPDARGLDIWDILSLPQEFRHSNPTLAEKCFLCWSLLRIHHKPQDDIFTAVFLYYLRLRSQIYRFRVQDSKGKGLSYFQKYYDSSTDEGDLATDARLQEIFYTAMRDRRVLKTEFRLVPPSAVAATVEDAIPKAQAALERQILSFIKNHLYTLILIYGQTNRTTCSLADAFTYRWNNALYRIRKHQNNALADLLRSFNVSLESIHMHRFGIIYHLLKMGETRERRACFVQENAGSQRQQYEHFSFGSARFLYDVSVAAISNVRDRCPALSRLIIGLDAASLEIPTEPWVFAPSFREARRRNAMLSHHAIPAAQKALLGITYHVGEDFRHPISGLRHMDEAMDWLGLHPGDRIGHGLAMSIDADRWYRHNGLVVMPRIEWLEDNLWLWHLITQKPQLSKLASYQSSIETQINDCAREIYGSLNGVTMESLFSAYAAKVFPVSVIQRKSERIKRFCDANTDCFRCDEHGTFFPCWRDNEDASLRVWTQDTLALSYHCDFYKRKMEETIMISPTAAQVEMTKVLQLYLKEKTADNGIIIESNPSSNAIIGEMDGILLHPIWDLREGGEKRVMTSVNTDDPSVFNATVANEHAQIYYALRYHGLSAEEALDDVNTIREIGLRASFIRDVQGIHQLFKDYEQIINAIVE